MKPPPGDYTEFVRRFRERSLDELRKTERQLPESGCGWPRANYARALRAVISEKTNELRPPASAASPLDG